MPSLSAPNGDHAPGVAAPDGVNHQNVEGDVREHAAHVAQEVRTEEAALRADLATTPRWPALLTALSVAGLNAALPDELQFGPRWLLPTVVGVLLLLLTFAFRREHHALNQKIGYALNIVLTLDLCVSVVLLINALPKHRETPMQLLQSAGALWLTNVLVFALWYWRMDAGGPHRRDARPGHSEGAFLFPQMTLDNCNDWSPHFVDYLFLAFNTSTALSPTDTPVLTRWGKCLMMLQSLISLLVLALLAARAVNVL